LSYLAIKGAWNMDMQIDSQRIRSEREKRAWSQEHLAKLTGLGLRTVQRIESSGSASYESVSAIAAVLEISVSELRVVRPVVPPVAMPVAVSKSSVPVLNSKPKSWARLVPAIAVAVAILVGTAIAKHTSDSRWLVMAGPLLLALVAVGADVLAFRLQGEKGGPSTPTLLLVSGFVGGCAIVALGDPARVATMIPLLGAVAASTISARSLRKQKVCRAT
jgi:transcriptional regulator with XRE-family HTH domain